MDKDITKQSIMVKTNISKYSNNIIYVLELKATVVCESRYEIIGFY